MSTFTALVPQRNRSRVYMGDKVKLHFPKIQGKTQLLLYFGADLAKRIGIDDGDIIGLSINDSNPLIWLIQKADMGWKVANVNKKKPNAKPLYRLQIAWNRPIPEGLGDKPKFAVGTDIYSGGVRIFLPGTTPEDRLI